MCLFPSFTVCIVNNYTSYVCVYTPQHFEINEKKTFSFNMYDYTMTALLLTLAMGW